MMIYLCFNAPPSNSIAGSIINEFAWLKLGHLQHFLDKHTRGVGYHSHGIDCSINFSGWAFEGPEDLHHGTAALWGATLEQSLIGQGWRDFQSLWQSSSQCISIHLSHHSYKLVSEVSSLLSIVGVGKARELPQNSKDGIFILTGAHINTLIQVQCLHVGLF